MSKIKYRKLYFLFMLLEILLLIMISGWYYFSERKMGMIRHILFKNVYKFPKYFTDINIKILLGVMAVFILIQLVLIIQSKKFILTFIINLVLILMSGYIILNYNVDKIFIYYYIVSFCGLFNLVRFFLFLTLKFK